MSSVGKLLKTGLRCHSTYGWHEHVQKNRKGEEEVFVSGYMKLQQDTTAHTLKLSCWHGLLIDRLGWKGVGRGCSLAFGVGGGSNLGLRGCRWDGQARSCRVFFVGRAGKLLRLSRGHAFASNLG